MKLQLLTLLSLSLIATPLIALEKPQAMAETAQEKTADRATDASFPKLDDKYLFDDIEQVKRFNKWNINGWNVIDSQSLLVHTSPSTSYLLVLQRRVPQLRFTEHIALSSTGSSVHARFDTLEILDRHSVNIPASIAMIYKLKGKDQRRKVKAQIREEKPLVKKAAADAGSI